MCHRGVLLGLSSIVACSTVLSVSAQAPKPTFEVASVKHNTGGTGGSSASSPGRYSATNRSLYRLILEAYEIPQATALFAIVVDGRAFALPRGDDRCDRNCSSTSQI